MARYSIDETTLTALGDAVRSKVGETEIRGIPYTSKTYHFDGLEYSSTGDFIPIPVCGATTIKITKIATTDTNDSSLFTEYCDCIEYIFANTSYDEFTLGKFTADTVGFYTLGGAFTYDFEATWYDADGNQMDAIINEEVIKTMTPERMADEINNMGALLDPSLLTLTGNLNGKFAYSGMVDFINLYGDQMTTKDVYELDSAFTYSTLERLPFPINCADYLQTSLSNMCFNATKLKEAPILVDCTPKSISALFSGCNSLRELPEDYGADWNWSTIDNSTSSYLMCDCRLKDCYSLRNAPMSLINHGGPKVNSATYTIYASLFYNCYVLDEVVGLGWPHTDVAYNSSSSWSSPFGSLLYCNYRLKEFTFAEMATPPKWANQTLDLSGRGYCKESNYSYYICNYNSGITNDKRVYDDATYQALKNDPDWFSTVLEYSRYNHTSAVNTINSLPDCTAYQSSGGGSANIIRFKQGEGSKTDGGAVSDLTDEEIAVAAAKGWTVSIVM